MNDVALLPVRGSVRRILVLRPRALGDVLLATPALRALKHGFPAVVLHVAVDDVLAPVLLRNPDIDRLWRLPRRLSRGRGAWWALARDLRRQHFDLVIDLHGSPRTALLARISGARNRVGYALRGRGRLYNLRIGRDSDRRGRRTLQYAARVGLDIAARCGATGPALGDDSLVYVADASIAARMAQVVEQELGTGPRVALAPAGTWQAKTYPPSAWVELGNRLVAAGCRVLLLWGPGEHALAARVQSGMSMRACLAPATSVDELAGMLRRLDLLICNDSGVKHLAVACGTPTLTILGPTNPTAWVPPHGPHSWVRAGVPCAACNLTRCRHHLCMRLLAPEEVARRALGCLGRPPGSFDVEVRPLPE